MRATDQQRLAADPGASVWVTASAGTGKTHVLTDRVLRLLLRDCPPERILCLTFTKAAAAEMANRLHQRLGAWAVADDATLSQALMDLTGQSFEAQDMNLARRLFARVLDTPGGLKVQTIHSFCEALLRRFPLEARLAPHFQVMDERQADEILQGALEGILEQDALTPAPLVAELTALVDQETFKGLMANLSSDRGRLQRLLDQPGGLDGLLASMRQSLGLGEDEGELAILNAAADPNNFDGPGLLRLAQQMLQGGKLEMRHGQAIADWHGAPETRVARFDTYLAGFFTKDGQGTPYAKPLTKKSMETIPDGLDILGEECLRLEDVRQRRNAVRVAAATELLLRLGARLIAAYQREKDRLALLDYDDLVLKAGYLLSVGSSTEWVLYKLDGGLDHILIDEAQDTNPEQWQVVRTLADEFFTGDGAYEDGDDSLMGTPRTLFAVGDVKQSIYSFQRADPAAFQAMRNHFAARVGAAKRRWHPVELALSFRSTPAVLEAVNAIFADPEASDGLIFADNEAVRHIPNRATDAGLVEIWPTEQPETVEEQPAWAPPTEQRYQDSPVARLARRIAKQVEEWLQQKEMLVAQGRPIGPGDILILVQRRANFVEAMVRALKRRGIPVAGVDRMVLTEQLAVMDLIALGRFLLLPEDDLNLAVVLKGPLIGWDDDKLFALAHGRRGSLWDALREHGANGEDPAYTALSELLAKVDFAPPFELFAELLGAGGGRRRILARLGPDANDPINEFLDLALSYERDHAPSLQGFLHWLERGETQIKRDLDQGQDQVRVMTVHGAKGLEAPIVFLADTVRAPDKTPALLWPRSQNDQHDQHDQRGGATPLWAPIRAMEEEVMRQARAQAEQDRDREYRRLFYVALTRAAERLYICGFEGKSGRKDHCWYEMAWRTLDSMPEIERPAELNGGLRLANPQTSEVRPGPIPAPPTLHGLPSWAGQPAPMEPVPPRPLAPSRPDGPEPSVASPLGEDGQARFQRGNHIHRLLQTLPDLAENQREEAAARYLALPAHVLDQAQQAEILAETMAVLRHPDFAAIFSPDARAEVPLTALLSGRVVSGQVDRLLVTDSEILLIDYKTNRPPPKSVADVDITYLRQLAGYHAILQEIYPEKSIYCALLWTMDANLMAIDGAILRAYAP
ncbi:MAG: double-strand break repair helicase AddA [Rhodospirillaceae bacterium]|nr:double-strand break repair helicase AddA [Rhodospirillaceae bacterium]